MRSIFRTYREDFALGHFGCYKSYFDGIFDLWPLLTLENANLGEMVAKIKIYFF